jgi:hypothetical protein
MSEGPGLLRNHHAAESSCRLVVRNDAAAAEILQFAMAGLEIGQQVVVMADPTCLKEIARRLAENGVRAEALLRNGRLVFLTAPECLSQLTSPGEILQRGPLRRQLSVVRWVSDWSWAYANGTPPATLLDYQRRVHDFVRSLTDLSLCTVQCGRIERSALLAMVADHRRAARAARSSA